MNKTLGRPKESPDITWTKTRPQKPDEEWSSYIRYRVAFAHETGDISIYRLSLNTMISQPNLHKFRHGETFLGRASLDRIANYMGILAK